MVWYGGVDGMVMVIMVMEGIMMMIPSFLVALVVYVYGSGDGDGKVAFMVMIMAMSGYG